MVRLKTAVLIPTAHRPKELERCLKSIFDSGPLLPDKIIVSPFDDEPDSLRVAYRFPVDIYPRSRDKYALGSIYGWNHCYQYTQLMDAVVLGADDQVYRKDWLGNALYALSRMNNYGLVAFNDGCSDGNEYAAHFLVSKSFLRDWQGDHIYPPVYKTWWCDREISDIAKREGCYVWGEDVWVDHIHYSFHLSPKDKTYAEAEPNYAADGELYFERKRQNFPVTWQGTVYRE